MHFRAVNPRTSLSAAVRAGQINTRRATVARTATVRVSQTTRGTTLRIRRPIADDSSTATEARYV